MVKLCKRCDSEVSPIVEGQPLVIYRYTTNRKLYLVREGRYTTCEELLAMLSKGQTIEVIEKRPDGSQSDVTDFLLRHIYKIYVSDVIDLNMVKEGIAVYGDRALTGLRERKERRREKKQARGKENSLEPGSDQMLPMQESYYQSA